MARENVSFTRYYYKYFSGGGGGVGQDALPGPLHLLVQIVAIPPKILGSAVAQW